jgi:hypothetical protein
MTRDVQSPIDRVASAIDDMPGWLPSQDTAGLREFIVKSSEVSHRLEAMKAEAIRRFEKARGYEADGALGMVPWMVEHSKLSGGQAAQRVEVARQLGELPRTEEALARGEVDLCRGASVRDQGTTAGQHGNANGQPAASRTQLIIKVGVDTLAKTPGAPAGELEWGGAIPAESVRRIACDTAITRITGLGELEWEVTHASRTIPPATRRALVLRDHHCVFPGCDRPQAWCDGHHLVHWADGGPTKLENLGLVCTQHHRKVHEEGWTLRRKDGRFIATPPPLKVAPHARSA